MLPNNLQHTLPSSDELIDSDDFPGDNEEQNFIPNVLLFLLEYIWKQRQDWFFAVDMGGITQQVATLKCLLSLMDF